MFKHEFSKRVRYAETDKMGYLYYGNYALYYEIGRVEAFRSIGISYKDIEDDHQLIMPVLELNIKYRRPAYYDELILVKSSILELPSKIIPFQHELYNPNGELINSAVIKLCFVDRKTNRMINLPEFINEKLKPFYF